MFGRLVLLLCVSSSAAAGMTLDDLAASQLKAKQAAESGANGSSPRIDESLPVRRVVSIMNGRSGWAAMVESRDGKNVILRAGEKLEDRWQVVSIDGKGMVLALGGTRRAVKFGEVYQQSGAFGGSLPLPPLPYPAAR